MADCNQCRIFLPPYTRLLPQVQKLTKTMTAIVHSLAIAESCDDDKGGSINDDGTDDEDSKNHQMHMQGVKLLSRVLLAVMNSSAPPMRKKVDAIRAINGRHVADGLVDGPVFCAVTGVELEDMCVEVRPAGKTSAATSGATPMLVGMEHNPATTNTTTANAHQQYIYLRPIVVHTDLEHFFNMFWYCFKLEHVVRHMARCWLEDYNALSTTSAPAAS
jgi:hypothetical protein